MPARRGVLLTARSIEALIVGSHLRWSGVWQRPNHVLTRLSQRVPVLVVEEPLAADTDTNVLASIDGITVLTPHRVHASDAVDGAAVGAALDWLRYRQAGVWLYTPMMLPLATPFGGAPIVYDKMDQLGAFLGADPRLSAREDALLERAAVVFAGGASLWRSVEKRVRRGLPLPSGVDVAHFAAAVHARPHEALFGLRRPVFGYIGVIDERLDLHLIEQLADARPDATIVMVGPVAKIAPDSLPRRPNIVYLGQRTYAELPNLLAGFDVALMPFAIGPATEFISPTKTLEYLAAACPVVSTPVADVVKAFVDVVRFAATPESFIAAVAEAERGPRKAYDAETGLAAELSWDGIVARMLDELAEAGILLEAPMALRGSY